MPKHLTKNNQLNLIKKLLIIYTKVYEILSLIIEYYFLDCHEINLIAFNKILIEEKR